MLRHVISHLRRQDWTSAFIELVVVVVGVVVGVQAANWNDTRQRDAKAAVFTERLRSDLCNTEIAMQPFAESRREPAMVCV